VAVWTEQDKILESVISPVAVDMFDFDRHSARILMAFGPSTLHAAFAIELSQHTTQKVQRNMAFYTALQNESARSASMSVGVLALEGAVTFRVLLKFAAAAIQTRSMEYGFVHCSMLHCESAIRMADLEARLVAHSRRAPAFTLPQGARVERAKAAPVEVVFGAASGARRRA